MPWSKAPGGGEPWGFMLGGRSGAGFGSSGGSGSVSGGTAGLPLGHRPQFVALELAGVGARQGVEILDGARILVGCDPGLDVILQLASQGGIALAAGHQHDERRHERAERKSVV